ncbi:hypothetical protein Tco_1394294 [Tanacetum coccineum]
MADTRTMAELLRAPIEGNVEAIVVPLIPAESFDLKHSLLNLVTSKQFFGFEKEDPHAHICWFNKINSTLKYKDVPHFTIKLMFFLFSIDGPARIWLEKEPPRSIQTWDDLVSYTQDVLKIIENKSKVRTSRNKPVVSKVSTNTSTSSLSPDVAALTNGVKALLIKNTTPPTASFKAVAESCVTCGVPHPYYQCPATNGNNFLGYQDNIQAYVSAAAATILQQNNKLENMLSIYFQMNKPLGSRSLPSNTVANPKGDMKAITTRSGVSYDGPPIPPPISPYLKVVEKEPEVTKDPMQPSTKKVQPTDVQLQAPTFEPVISPKPKQDLPYSSRLNNQKLRERDDHQMMKFL